MTNEFGLSDRTMQQLSEALSRFPSVERAAIFGSRALGNFKNGSDIDLALFGSVVDEKTVLRLSALLNEELPLPYHVDVISFELCGNDELKRHILEKGKTFPMEGRRR
jgi:uncharacterized protein